MAARPLILVTEREYLNSSYSPDCEFEDGILVERNVGTEKHSWLQAALAAYFFRRRKAWGLNVYTEQRYRIRAGKYKLPDVSVMVGTRPSVEIPDQPPLLVIEILSPVDQPLRVDRTIAEWLEFGVEYVWVVDPENFDSVLYTKQGRQVILDETLRIPGTAIEVPIRELDDE